MLDTYEMWNVNTLASEGFPLGFGFDTLIRMALRYMPSLQSIRRIGHSVIFGMHTNTAMHPVSSNASSESCDTCEYFDSFLPKHYSLSFIILLLYLHSGN